MKRFLSLFVVVVFLFQPLHSQFNFNADTVKAGKYDTGKMWTFEFPPFDYLKEKYGFEAAKSGLMMCASQHSESPGVLHPSYRETGWL
ncbi:MAG: hypothetical protein IPG53_05905 [Ignavibacteriales bacterium]|nr:hypothetical protein [Ignavibacteriales bacterium]